MVRAEFQRRSIEELQILVWGCWGIWGERNRRVWNGAVLASNQILLQTKFYVAGWDLAQLRESSAAGLGRMERTHWTKPEAGRVKLNVDAAVRADRCGLGWVLRNENGDFLACAAKVWQGRLSPWEAELIGIREALSWVLECGWNCVDVETDATRAMAEIQNGSSISAAGVVAEDVRDICTRISEVSFGHIRRSANKVAHGLAQTACSM
ncbi:unnamed protein product, partial [Cuscuta europaea]